MSKERNMGNYIATFYSHFGALSLYKELQAAGVRAEMMSVPRKLSSSCGICVSFDCDDVGAARTFADAGIELEGLYQAHDAGFAVILQN